MATSLLTPKTADPVTGLTTDLIAWHFTASAVQDVFEGCNLLATGGWTWNIMPDATSATNPPLWQIHIQKGGFPPVIVNDTDWICYDGRYVIKLTDSEVTADYTTTAYTLPSA
jgi:hypothetical protein